MADKNLSKVDRLNQIKAELTRQLQALGELTVEFEEKETRLELEAVEGKMVMGVARLDYITKNIKAEPVTEVKVEMEKMPYIPARLGSAPRIERCSNGMRI